MKLINNGNLEPIQEKSYGFFGNEKISTSLRVGNEPEDPLLRELYDIIIKAAGDDGVLQENELINPIENACSYEICYHCLCCISKFITYKI